MRTSGRILVAIAVIVLAAVLARNLIVKAAAGRAVRQATGFNLIFKKVDVSLLTPTVEVDGLRLTNPPDFPEDSAYDMDRLYVRYSPLSFFSDEIRLPEMVIDIPRVVLVIKEDGETNLERMNKTLRQKRAEAKPPVESPPPTGPKEEGPPPEGKKEQQPPSRPSEKSKAAQVRIDRLTIQLGTVEIHDYSKGGEKPKISTQDLKVNRTYENVVGLETIGYNIATEVAARKLAEALGDFSKKMNDPSERKELGEKVEKAMTNIAQTVGDFLKGFKKKAGE